MSYKSPSYPTFPMSEPHHFSDYGFDTQFDYFQVLEEARNHKREAAASSSAGTIIDSLQFKLQKPISSSSDKSSSFSIDAGPQKTRYKKKRHWRWWNKALLVFSCSSSFSSSHPHNHIFADEDEEEDERDVHHARARAFRAWSVSGPVLYMPNSAAETPRRARSEPTSGPLGIGFVSPGGGSPYLSLRELNSERQQHLHLHRMSASSSPFHLDT